MPCKPIVKEGETEGTGDHDLFKVIESFLDVQEGLVSFAHPFFADVYCDGFRQLHFCLFVFELGSQGERP